MVFEMSQERQRFCITGICGFVGSSIARNLLALHGDCEICGIDNLSRPGSELNVSVLRELGIEVFHGDIRCWSDLESLPATDWVIDAAANPSVLAGVDGKSSSRQLIEHNLVGTINTLEYCSKWKAGFMLISTSRVYSIDLLAGLEVTVNNQAYHPSGADDFPEGLSGNGVSERFSTAAPISLYGSTKLASEILALEYGFTFDFPVWINRCGVLAGAGQFGTPQQGIFSFWVNGYARKYPLQYIGFDGCGYQVRDALHPQDLTRLLLKQIKSPMENNPVYNVGGGMDNSMSLAQLSAWCEDRFGFHQVKKAGVSRKFDIPWMVMDHARVSETFSWKPEISMEMILDEIADHCRENPDWLEISGVK